MKSWTELLVIILLDLTAIMLIGLQIHLLGWLLFILGVILLFFCNKQCRKDFFLLYFSIGLLGITPITTNISYEHIFLMGIPLTLAIAVPYLVSRYVYKDYLVRFKFHHGRRWYKKEIAYIFFTAIVAYFIIPFFLKNTGSYHNWTVQPGFSYLIRLSLGTNFLGIWDELFFISTVLGIVRRYLSFPVANFVQSILFTSFLYELGFRGWGFIMIFLFALIQGYIFKKTESLFYIITIHLTIDFILYLALLHAYYPSWVPIFL